MPLPLEDLRAVLAPVNLIWAHLGRPAARKRHGMNVQVLASPAGKLIWASPALSGAVHSICAARSRGVIDVQLQAVVAEGLQEVYFRDGDRRPPLNFGRL